jgi:hypothetical protein
MTLGGPTEDGSATARPPGCERGKTFPKGDSDDEFGTKGLRRVCSVGALLNLGFKL